MFLGIGLLIVVKRQTTMAKVIEIGLLPADHPIFTGKVIVYSVPKPPETKKLRPKSARNNDSEGQET